MGHGSKAKYGFYLNTQSFTNEENLLLVKTLKDKFNLNSTVHKARQNYIIYIKADSMSNFKNIVKPYFHESMLYKLD